jgi:hypothetical protein
MAKLSYPAVLSLMVISSLVIVPPRAVADTKYSPEEIDAVLAELDREPLAAPDPQPPVAREPLEAPEASDHTGPEAAPILPPAGLPCPTRSIDAGVPFPLPVGSAPPSSSIPIVREDDWNNFFPLSDALRLVFDACADGGLNGLQEDDGNDCGTDQRAGLLESQEQGNASCHAADDEIVTGFIVEQLGFQWVVWVAPEAGLVELALADNDVRQSDLPDPVLPARDAGVGTIGVPEISHGEPNAICFNSNWHPFSQELVSLEARRVEGNQVAEKTLVYKYWGLDRHRMGEELISIHLPARWLIALNEIALRPRTWAEVVPQTQMENAATQPSVVEPTELHDALDLSLRTWGETPNAEVDGSPPVDLNFAWPLNIEPKHEPTPRSIPAYDPLRIAGVIRPRTWEEIEQGLRQTRREEHQRQFEALRHTFPCLGVER